MMKLMDLNCRLCKLENKHSLPVGTLKIKRKGQVEKKCNSEAILLPQFPNTLENRSKKLGTPSLGQIPSQQSIFPFLWAAPRSQRSLPGHQYIPPGNLNAYRLAQTFRVDKTAPYRALPCAYLCTSSWGPTTALLYCYWDCYCSLGGQWRRTARKWQQWDPSTPSCLPTLSHLDPKPSPPKLCLPPFPTRCWRPARQPPLSSRFFSTPTLSSVCQSPGRRWSLKKCFRWGSCPFFPR